MTARLPQHAEYVVHEPRCDYRAGGYRHARMRRHQQVRKLLPKATWRRRMEYAVVAFIAMTIGAVAGAAVLVAGWILWNIVGDAIRAAGG